MFIDKGKHFGRFPLPDKNIIAKELKNRFKKGSCNFSLHFVIQIMQCHKIKGCRKPLIFHENKEHPIKLKINNIKILSAVLLTSLLLFAFWTETDDININNAALNYNKVYAEKSENETNVEPIEKEVTDESAKNDSSETDIIRSCSNVDKKQVVLPCTISEFGEKSVCDIFSSAAMEKNVNLINTRNSFYARI